VTAVQKVLIEWFLGVWWLLISRNLLPNDCVLRNKHTYLINTTTGMSHLTITISGSCCQLRTLSSALVFNAPRFAINHHCYLQVRQLDRWCWQE